MTITATMVKELRDRTGVGMGDCKKALEEANGDMDLAITNLRKKGLTSAGKKEGRETKEGMIGISETPNAIGIVEVNAETDFVAKNDRFKEFVSNIAEEVALTNPPSLDAFFQQQFSKDSSLTIDQYRATIIQAIGENIQIRRILCLQKSDTKSFGLYSHLGGKIVTMVELTGANSEEALAKNIAMHTAAAAPEYLSPETVPAHIIENEKEIAKAQMQGKPAHIIDKIIDGKINAYFESACLVLQKYIKDDSLSITDLVNQKAKEIGKPLTVTNFIRWSVGQ
ncbi:MAG: translation elongation factor Ts [Parachlamydiaceae bacterium]|nr:translation elongation factor Ts [Parachlamydiaceae bacterium]